MPAMLAHSLYLSEAPLAAEVEMATADLPLSPDVRATVTLIATAAVAEGMACDQLNDIPKVPCVA